MLFINSFLILGMNLIDRYILKQFVNTLVFSIVALCIIFLVVNLIENLDDFIDNNAGFMEIAEYYIHFFPEILKILTPVATLLSTLFTIGRLSTQNEITAMKSGSMSLYRLMMPLVVFGFLLSLGQLYFNGWVVPKANEKKLELESIYLNKNEKGGPIFNLYLRDAPTRNIVMNYYNSEDKEGSKVAIEKFSDNYNPRLISRIEADTIKWNADSSGWVLKNGIVRNYSDKSVKIIFFDEKYPEINITHDQIIQLRKSTEEMTLDELHNYIKLLEKGGKDVRRQMIDYYSEYAFPYANLVVILFGVPFASIRKRGGIAVQIGAAMVVSFTYMIFTEFSKTVGFSAGLTRWCAGWFVNIWFVIFAVINIFNTKT